MSADELKKLAVDNKGKLSLEQIMDIPIKNLDELHDYLAKVKDLNLTENGHPITPGHLQLDNTPAGAYLVQLSLGDGLHLQQLPLVINESKNLYMDYELSAGVEELYLVHEPQLQRRFIFGKEFSVSRKTRRTGAERWDERRVCGRQYVGAGRRQPG